VAAMMLGHLLPIFRISRTFDGIFGVRFLRKGSVGVRGFRLTPEEANVPIRPAIARFLHSNGEVFAVNWWRRNAPIGPNPHGSLSALLQ